MHLMRLPRTILWSSIHNVCYSLIHYPVESFKRYPRRFSFSSPLHYHKGAGLKVKQYDRGQYETINDDNETPMMIHQKTLLYKSINNRLKQYGTSYKQSKHVWNQIDCCHCYPFIHKQCYLGKLFNHHIIKRCYSTQRMTQTFEFPVEQHASALNRIRQPSIRLIDSSAPNDSHYSPNKYSEDYSVEWTKDRALQEERDNVTDKNKKKIFEINFYPPKTEELLRSLLQHDVNKTSDIVFRQKMNTQHHVLHTSLKNVLLEHSFPYFRITERLLQDIIQVVQEYTIEFYDKTLTDSVHLHDVRPTTDIVHNNLTESDPSIMIDPNTLLSQSEHTLPPFIRQPIKTSISFM